MSMVSMAKVQCREKEHPNANPHSEVFLWTEQSIEIQQL